MGRTAHFDVVVIGSGPAGASLATFLSREGLRIALVEQRSFPRQHIGESLLAMSMPIIDELKIRTRLDDAGFVRKLGAVFAWGQRSSPMVLRMSQSDHAYQVERPSFDLELLKLAQESGATVINPAHAHELLFDEHGDVCGVTVRDAHGEFQQKLRTRWVVDDSGVRRFVARALNLDIAINGVPRVCVNAYFQGARRYPPPNGGDIITEACNDGWLWLIPLRDDTASVGLVSDIDSLPRPFEKQLTEQIASTTYIRRLLEPASCSIEPKGFVYRNCIVTSPFWRNRCVLVGDAAQFVDPLFSTGVHAALYSAALAAAGLMTVIRKEISECDVAAWYDERFRAHYQRVDATVRLLYGLHPGTTPFWLQRSLEAMSDSDAEECVRALGSMGVGFFRRAAQIDSGLQMPAAIVRRLQEFVCELRPVALRGDEVMKLGADVRVTRGWTRMKMRVVPALVVEHVANRIPRIECPLDGFRARLLQGLDGQRNATKAIQCAGPVDATECRQGSLFLGALLGAGILEQTGTKG